MLSHIPLFVTPWIEVHQVSLSFAIFWSLLKLMSIESTMPSNPFIQEYRDFKGIKRTLRDNPRNKKCGTGRGTAENQTRFEDVVAAHWVVKTWLITQVRAVPHPPAGRKHLHTAGLGWALWMLGWATERQSPGQSQGCKLSGKPLALWGQQEETKIEAQLNQELKAPFH